MVLLPYATDDAHSRSRQITRGGRAQAVLAIAWTLIVLAALVWFGWLPLLATLAALAAASAAAIACGSRFMRRLGGFTGDFLGATQQVAVIAVLVAIRWCAVMC